MPTRRRCGIPVIVCIRNAAAVWPHGLTALLICAIVGACNQPFDPRGPLDQKMVVFSILSTDRSQQIVRVEPDYMPNDYDPLAYTSDNSIAEASVTLKSGSLTFRLRDTTFLRSDTSRYKSPLRCYVLNAFSPEYGKSYQINVQSAQFGSVSGTVLVPAKPAISLEITSYLVLDSPLIARPEANILFPIVCGKNARAFIGRMFVYYDVVVDGEWVERRSEIPVSFKYSGTEDFQFLSYGSLTQVPTNMHAVGVYNNLFYSKVLGTLAYETYVDTKIVFNRVVFTVLQVDPNLYKYYIVTHAFNDPHSARLDEPEFSNILKGEGIVGAYTLDSLVHVLPEGFGFNKR